MKTVVITGTDTGVGKTVFSAGLTQALAASYWKPVQAGLEEATDSEVVARLSGRPVLPEAYRLCLPASPHRAAQHQGLTIDPARLSLPRLNGPLVVEGAGGLMVPLTPRLLYLDVIADWQAPVLLCCRTSLGTINHSLLSLAVLRQAGCCIVGVVFIGDDMPDNRRMIAELGGVRDLGRLPLFAPLSPATLKQAFSDIDVASIREAMSCKMK